MSWGCHWPGTSSERNGATFSSSKILPLVAIESGQTNSKLQKTQSSHWRIAIQSFCTEMWHTWGFSLIHQLCLVLQSHTFDHLHKTPNTSPNSGFCCCCSYPKTFPLTQRVMQCISSNVLKTGQQQDMSNPPLLMLSVTFSHVSQVWKGIVFLCQSCQRNHQEAKYGLWVAGGTLPPQATVVQECKLNAPRGGLERY